MARSTSYYYMILKVANPTAEALNHGVDANDLLEAADFYNGRFKGLKQIMLLKTDGVKIHIILSLAELTGVTVKRTYSDFSPHISVFSNFLLNQKKWSQYSQDYRRLLHVFSEPQVCTHDEVMNVLGQLAYKEELAENAESGMKFVGPSERILYKWYLHVRSCLQTAPHLAFEHGEFAGGAADPSVDEGIIGGNPVGQTQEKVKVRAQAQAQTQAKPVSKPKSVVEEGSEESADASATTSRKKANYTASAAMIRKQYQQVAKETKLALPKDDFPQMLELHEEIPAEFKERNQAAAREREAVQGAENAEENPAVAMVIEEDDQIEEETTVTTDADELKVLNESIAETENLFAVKQDMLQQLDASDQTAYEEIAYFDISADELMNDEQLMAILHGMVLTQNLGDAEAVARKKAAIAQIKHLIAPWATFG